MPPLLQGWCPLAPQCSDLQAGMKPVIRVVSLCLTLFSVLSVACCRGKWLFGASFHVILMNINGGDRAVANGACLHKQGSLCSRPRLCCCQDLSRQLQFTIPPWLHETGLLQSPTSHTHAHTQFVSLARWQKVQLIWCRPLHFWVTPGRQKTPHGRQRSV